MFVRGLRMDRTRSVCLVLCLLSATAAAAEIDERSPPLDVGPSGGISNIPADLIPPAEGNKDFTSMDRPLDASSAAPLTAPSSAEVKSPPVATNAPSIPSLSTAAGGPRAPARWAPPIPDVTPARDAQGRVIFPRGSNPTIICAPTKVCDIELQPGERVQGAPHIGDSVRWKVSPAVSGVGERAVTHLIVKPTEAGLDTNLIVTTDRRTYHIRLVSGAAHYLASVAFEGAEDQEGEWESLAGSPSETRAATEEMPVVAVNRLNFNYRIKVVKGKPSFRPLRAMDDGYHTYIAMNDEMPLGEAPALIGISEKGEEQMINYRLKGNLFVVDGTVSKLALISGAGRQQERIELTREPCRQRGWLGICWDAKE